MPVDFGAGAGVAPASSVALARCGAPASAAGASMQGHAARWGVLLVELPSCLFCPVFCNSLFVC